MCLRTSSDRCDRRLDLHCDSVHAHANPAVVRKHHEAIDQSRSHTAIVPDWRRRRCNGHTAVVPERLVSSRCRRGMLVLERLHRCERRSDPSNRRSNADCCAGALRRVSFLSHYSPLSTPLPNLRAAYESLSHSSLSESKPVPSDDESSSTRYLPWQTSIVVTCI